MLINQKLPTVLLNKAVDKHCSKGSRFKGCDCSYCQLKKLATMSVGKGSVHSNIFILHNDYRWWELYENYYDYRKDKAREISREFWRKKLQEEREQPLL